MSVVQAELDELRRVVREANRLFLDIYHANGEHPGPRPFTISGLAERGHKLTDLGVTDMAVDSRFWGTRDSSNPDRTERRASALKAIEDARLGNWGERPRHVSFAGLTSMAQTLLDRAITPDSVSPHHGTELAALLLMILEAWQ